MAKPEVEGQPAEPPPKELPTAESEPQEPVTSLPEAESAPTERESEESSVNPPLSESAPPGGPTQGAAAPAGPVDQSPEEVTQDAVSGLMALHGEAGGKSRERWEGVVQAAIQAGEGNTVQDAIRFALANPHAVPNAKPGVELKPSKPAIPGNVGIHGTPPLNMPGGAQPRTPAAPTQPVPAQVPQGTTTPGHAPNPIRPRPAPGARPGAGQQRQSTGQPVAPPAPSPMTVKHPNVIRPQSLIHMKSPKAAAGRVPKPTKFPMGKAPKMGGRINVGKSPDLHGHHAYVRQGIYTQPGAGAPVRPKPARRLSEAEVMKAEGKKRELAHFEAESKSLSRILSLVQLIK
jgi:hypothetical protein